MFSFALLVASVAASDEAGLLQVGHMHSTGCHQGRKHAHKVLPGINPYSAETVICPFLKTAVVSLGLELEAEEHVEGKGRKNRKWTKKRNATTRVSSQYNLMSWRTYNNLLNGVGLGPKVKDFLLKNFAQVVGGGLPPPPLGRGFRVDVRAINGTAGEANWSSGVTDPVPSKSRFMIWASLATDGYIGAKQIAQAIPQFKYLAAIDQAAGYDVGQFSNPPFNSANLNNLFDAVGGMAVMITFFGECGIAVPECPEIVDTCRMKIKDFERMLLEGRATLQRPADSDNPTQQCVQKLLPGYYAKSDLVIPDPNSKFPAPE